MRFVSCAILLSCLAGLPGCSLFNKSSGSGNSAGLPTDGKNPTKFPTGDPLFSTTSKNSESVLLAGHVIDGLNNRPQGAFIRYVCLEDGKEAGAPVEVAASPGGYFTIPGLKRGATYKLIARAKNGDKTLAGTTYTAAPNPRIVIQIREDLNSSTTPPIPGPPAYDGKKDTSNDTSSAPGGERQVGATTWGPAAQPTDTSLPPRVNAPPTTPATPTGGWIPGIAERPTDWPPKAAIPPQLNSNAPPIRVPGMPESQERGPNAAPTSDLKPASSSARVPSCVLVGKQLVNFALNDLNGEPWEFRTNKKGKLVLLDFWGSTCLPCRETIPHLRNLQNQHGWSGLEIIGIAYEGGGSAQEQAHRVATACQKLQTNYRQLLGANPNCPVREQFGVRFIPHMVLVDEQGWVIWRHEGTFNGNDLQQLDQTIKQRLGVR